jgi:ABC-type transport system substrate-binding protein
MTRKDGDKFTMYKDGGKVKSRVNEAGNYTKPGIRKAIFERIKAGGKGGAPGQWSARKAQMMAQQYKKAGGGYKD